MSEEASQHWTRRQGSDALVPWPWNPESRLVTKAFRVKVYYRRHRARTRTTEWIICTFMLHRSLLLCGLSLVAASRVFSNCAAWASCFSGFSCCRAQALGEWPSVAAAGGLSSWGSHALEHELSGCGTWGLVAPQHVGSWIRDWTHISCIGRWVLYHWTTKSWMSNLKCDESLEWEVLGGTRNVTGKFHVASVFRKDSHEEMLLNWDSKDASQAKRTGKSVLDEKKQHMQCQAYSWREPDLFRKPKEIQNS